MIRFTALHQPAALLKTDVHLLFSSQSVYSQFVYSSKILFLNILTNHAIVNILFQTFSFNESKQLLHPSDGAFCRALAR